MKQTMKLYKERCLQEGKELWELVLDDEVEARINPGEDPKEVREEILSILQKSLDVMKESSSVALDKDVRSVTGMTGGNAKKMHDYFLSGESILGETASLAMAMAFSTSEVNASMGRIVASPTAGSAGIMPASLMTMRKKYGTSDEDLVRAILVATGLGNVIADNATFAGSEGGCQAECGAAAAMSAGAICYLRGADLQTIENSGTIALINIMGLICDPIGGMVEFPCNLRNASGVMNALTASDIALSGARVLVSFDEAVLALKRVGDSLKEELRETGDGGIAICPSALSLKKKYID